MIDDLKLERLKDYAKIKPFQITAKTKEDAQAFLELCPCSQSIMTFQEFVSSINTRGKEIEQSMKWTVKLTTRLQLAACQYVFGVRRNKLDVSLLWKGPNAKKRYDNMIERIPLMSFMIEENISEKYLDILNKQPIFTEYT